MTAPRRVAPRLPGRFAWTLAAALPCSFACGDQSNPAPAVAPAEADPPSPAPPSPAPAAAGPISLRCGDLLTPDDLNAAGVDPSGYDPDKTAAPGLGVNCMVGALSVTLFAGHQYGSMIEGFETMGPQSGVVAAEGPSVGSANQWTTMGPMNGLMFQSTNRRYAANLSGTDKPQLERLARAIDARVSKR